AGFTFSTTSANPAGAGIVLASCDRFCAIATLGASVTLGATNIAAADTPAIVVASNATRRADRPLEPLDLGSWITGMSLSLLVYLSASSLGLISPHPLSDKMV